jgi:oligosaccharide repeat unit polymerase
MMLSKLKTPLLVFIVALLFFTILPYERMTGASYIVLVISIFLSGFGYFLTKDLASPQVILCITWSLSLFLTSLNVEFVSHISHFNDVLMIKTWWVILSSIVSFFIGATLTMYPLRSNYREKFGMQRLHWSQHKLNLVIFISFSMAMSVYSFAVIKSGGLPAFSEDVNSIRAKFIPETLGVFLVLFQLVILSTTWKATIYGVKRSRFVIFLALVSFVCIMLTTQRVGAIEALLMSVFMFVVLWPYTPKGLRQRRKVPLLIFGIILLSIFVVGFVLIGQVRGLDFLQLTDIDSLILEQFYIYFAGPAPRNLQMAMEGGVFHGVNEAADGKLFFRPILWFLGFRNEILLNDTFIGPNNATALFHYYIDFGIAGIIIFSLFWGAVCGFVYGNFRRTLSLNMGIIYAIFASSIYFLPLSERFSEPGTFVKIVLFLIVASLLSKIRLNKSESKIHKMEFNVE